MTLSKIIRFLAAAFLAGGLATVAQAQATRTWVSGVGDDVNPCSRTAPCKTFAGAISKTAEGGEISTLDPGGFGALTITKAITIEGTHGAGFASVLNSGTNGFTINVISGIHVNDAVVIIRSVYFQGASQAVTPGINGINFIKAARVIVEDCHFENQGTSGITQNSLVTSANLEVTDCSFDNTATGILGKTTSGFATTHIDHCRFNGGTDGVFASSNAFITISNCNFNGLSGAFNGAVRSATGCQVNVANSVFANNNVAVNNSSSGGPLRLSNNDFYNNTTAIAGTAESANNNRFRGNTTDGTVTNVILVK